MNSETHKHISVFSTALFPPISYMTALLRGNEIYIEVHENYQRQTYRNRFHIFGPNGLQTVSIPVIHTHGTKMPVRDVKLEYQTPWQKQHVRSLITAYNHAPFFLYYQDDVLGLFKKNITFLLDFNIEALSIVLKHLKHKPDLHFTDTYHKEYPAQQDFRSTFSPKHLSPLTTHSSPLTTHYSPLTTYTQVFSSKHGFLPDLSILDLLFNEGPEAVGYLLH